MAFNTPLGPPPSARLPRKGLAAPALVEGALILIFRFYCKVQSPGSQLGRRVRGFDEARECNASLSFLGLVTFLRDFDVVADLILTEDAATLWRMHAAQCNHDRGRGGENHDTVSGNNNSKKKGGVLA